MDGIRHRGEGREVCTTRSPDSSHPSSLFSVLPSFIHIFVAKRREIRSRLQPARLLATCTPVDSMHSGSYKSCMATYSCSPATFSFHPFFFWRETHFMPFTMPPSDTDKKIKPPPLPVSPSPFRPAGGRANESCYISSPAVCFYWRLLKRTLSGATTRLTCSLCCRY